MTKVHTLAAGLLLLAGCASPSDTRVLTTEAHTPTNTPTLIPTERWDADFYEQVEDAAGEVLTGYFAASDEITQAGGENPTPMTGWVSPAWLPRELEGFTSFVTNQERTIGLSRWDTPVVQLARLTPQGIFDVGVMACVDTTEVMVVPRESLDPPNVVLEWYPHYDDFTGTDSEWATIEEYFAEVPVRVGDRRTIVFWLVGDSLDALVVDSSEEWWGANQCVE